MSTDASSSRPTHTEATSTPASGTEAAGTQATDTRATGTQATDTQATDTQAARTEAAGAEAAGTRATSTEQTEPSEPTGAPGESTGSSPAAAADPEPEADADPVEAPPPAELPGDAAMLAGLIRAHAERTGATRIIVGLTGGPGSGKSTTAARLRDEFTLAGERSAVVPMDGFHLAQRQLQALGLTEIKGAPETFDAHGYLALLQRLRHQGEEVVYAPTFDRTLEEPVAGSIAVPPDIRYVITEGNYLLHDAAPWPAVRAMLDAVWFLDPGEDIRINRLVRRHIQFGRTPNAALKRATTGSDASNAVLIAGTRGRADLVVTS